MYQSLVAGTEEPGQGRRQLTALWKFPPLSPVCLFTEVDFLGSPVYLNQALASLRPHECQGVLPVVESP